MYKKHVEDKLLNKPSYQTDTEQIRDTEYW